MLLEFCACPLTVRRTSRSRGSVWTFDQPGRHCCTSNFSGTTNNVLITVANTVTSGICPQVITRTWLIADACGNTKSCSQTVTVVDTTAPMITCPSNAIIETLNSNLPVGHPLNQGHSVG